MTNLSTQITFRRYILYFFGIFKILWSRHYIH